MMPNPFIQPAAFRRPSAILLLLAVACLPALPQTGPPASSQAPIATSAMYRIAGKLVNATTEEPVRRATVAILAEADSHTLASVESDSDGHFDFEGLAPGKYQLTASKRGFRTAFYDEHDGFFTAIVTGDAQDTGDLIFRIMPGSILRGVVTGDGGDPVENASVMLFLKPHANRAGDRINQAGSTSTDDTGAYEFSNLAAGEYMLAVKAQPWYAVHTPASRSGASSANDAAALKAALDVAYPITFFDSTIEEESASTILLTKGNREEANVSLHAVPALRLTVETPFKQGGSIARAELRQTIFGTQIAAESIGFFDAMKTGTAEFTGVAPGHYELEQGDPPRTAELDATSSQQVDPTLGTPTVEVSAIVRAASGSALPDSVSMSLESLDGAHRYVSMQTIPGQSGAIATAVSPGQWRLWVNSPIVQWQILSTAVNGRAHSGNLLTVADRPLSVVVTVSEGATRVEGFARSTGAPGDRSSSPGWKELKGISGVMVVLVPLDLSAMQGLARRDQSDSDGSFSLRGVVPGQYTVVAIENGWDLDWARPEVIGRFLPRGIGVTVTESSGKLLHLSQPVPVQTP